MIRAFDTRRPNLSLTALCLVAGLAAPVMTAGGQGSAGEPPGEDLEARQAWFWSQRSPLSGVRPYDKLLAARLSVMANPAFASASLPLLGGNWRPIGPWGLFEADAGFFNSSPQMDNGRVVGIAAPTAAGRPIFIATASGGVWRSSAIGLGWTPLTDNQCSLNMGAIALDPVDPRIIYAGTGEYNDFSFGCGILRSIDGGNTWTASNTGLRLSNGTSAIFGSLLVDPATAGSAASTVIIAATANALVRSTNSGSSWSVVLSGSPSSVVSTRPGVIFTGMRDLTAANAARRGLWKSTNTGATWTQLPSPPSSDASTMGRIELAVSPAAPDKVFAAITSSTTSKLTGLYVWDDAASSWTQPAAAGLYSGAARADFGAQGSYDLAIAVDPRDAKRIYLAGVRAYRSTDAGATFSPIGMEIHCDWHTIVIDPRNPDILYAGTDGGVFVSSDGGDTWVSQNAGLAITQYYPGVSVHPSGTLIMGGSQDNGTHQFNGTPYWDGFSGGDGGFTAINYQNGNIAYGEAQWSTTTGAAIYRRVGLARTLRVVGIDKTDRAQFIPPLIIDPVNPQKLYFGTHRLYVTTNEAAAWTPLTLDLTKGSGRINTIAVAPTDTLTIYVGTTDANVQVSRDGGVTFAPMIVGLPTGRVITDISVDPTNAAHALLTVQGFGGGHIFETNDAGATWRNISGNLVDAGANAATFVGSGNIFVGTDVGVFQTADDGVTWQAGPAGMPNVMIMDLVFQPAANLLVAATYGRGMFSYVVGGSPAVLRGDVNSDGKVDAFDALVIQQALISSLSATTAVFPRGDANCNGVIDAADVVLVLRFTVALPTPGACVGTVR